MTLAPDKPPLPKEIGIELRHHIEVAVQEAAPPLPQWEHALHPWAAVVGAPLFP